MIELLTAMLVIITGFYALFTFKILKANEKVVEQMRNQQEAMLRPYVSITPVLFPETHFFFLKIKNSGKTAAENLRLSIDKDFFKAGNEKDESNLRSFHAFKEKIDSFVPGAEMIFRLAQDFVIFGDTIKSETTPAIFTITAEYEYQQKKVKENTVIDLRPYYPSVLPHDPVVNQLKELRETIKNK